MGRRARHQRRGSRGYSNRRKGPSEQRTQQTDKIKYHQSPWLLVQQGTHHTPGHRASSPLQTTHHTTPHRPRKPEAVRGNGHAKRTAARPRPSEDGTRLAQKGSASHSRRVPKERTFPRHRVKEQRNPGCRVSGARISISTRTTDTTSPARLGLSRRGMSWSTGWRKRGIGLVGRGGQAWRGRRRVAD